MRHFTYISTTTNRAQTLAHNLSEILFFKKTKLKIPQWALAWSLFLSFALLTMSTNLYAQTVDTDGDGIADSIDLDDDNDGILDTAENAGCTNTLITPVSATSSPVYGNSQVSGATADKTINSTGFTGTGLAALATAPGTLDDSWLLQENLTSGFIEYTIPLSNVGGVVLWAPDAFNYPGGDAPIKDFTVTLFYGNNQTYTSPMYTTAKPTGSGSLPGAQVFTFPSSFSNVSKVRLNISAGWYDLDENNANFVSTESVTVRINYNMFLGEFRVLCGDQDTDGDGIPDRLDLDSDGDGCADAIEGGASFTTANLVTSTIAGGNSGAGYTGTSTNSVTQNLGNTVGSTATTLGVPTVAGTGQSFGFSQTGALNACLDTDIDGIPDVDDLDDDNDGILDTIELGCSFNQVVYKTGVLVTKSADVSFTLNAGYTLSNLVDGVDGNVYVARPTGDLTNKPLLTFEFPTPKVLTYLEVGHYSGQYLFSLGTTYKIQASNDNTTWFDLTGTLTYNNAATSTSGGLSSANSNIATFTSNTNSYKYYRIFGLAAAPGNGWATEVYFKESICSASDTDGDGIVNSLDLDSDGDGCPDAIEGGAAFTAANTTATGALSGSVSSAAATLGVPTVAGTGQTTGFSQNGALNACTDTDTDGIPDIEDVDDDNDGVLDTAEQSCAQVENLGNCTTTNFVQTLGIFTHCSGWNAFDFDPSATVDRSDFDFMALVNGKIRFDLQGSYTTPVTGKMVKVISPVTAGVSYTYSIDLVSSFIDMDGNKPYLRAINNADGSIIGSLYLNGTGQRDLTFIAPSSSISITVGYDTRVGNGGSFFWEDGGLNGNGQVAQTCTDIDTDGDGTPNRLDLDSDGDGCPDAVEAGTTFIATSGVATVNQLTASVIPAPYGTNGFANGLETVTDDGSYKGTYSYSNATNASVKGCTDTDIDGIPDVFDLDDDNDGVLDTIESGCLFNQVVSKTGVVVTKSATVGYTFNGAVTLSNLVDGVDNNVNIMNAPTGVLNNNDLLTFEFPTPKVITYLEVGHFVNQYLFSLNTTYKIQASNDNTNWLDLTGSLTYNNVATSTSGGLSSSNSNIATFASNTNSYKFYRIFGLAAAPGVGWATEVYFKESICSEVDTDGDGTANRLDTDSDGDGCPDAVEAGTTFIATSGVATANQLTASVIPAPYGTNGFANGLETVTDNGTYKGTYSYNDATNALVKGCTDTDTDGIPDVDDLDDDNDGILDTAENAACTILLPPTNTGTKGAIVVPSGWTIANSTPDIGDVNSNGYSISWGAGCTSVAPAAPNGHTQFVYMYSTTQESFKTRVDNWIVGKTYQLTYYQANFGTSATPAGEVTVKLGTTIIDKFTPVQGCGWTTRVVTFTPTETAQDLSFMATGAVEKSAVISVSANAISTAECDVDGDGIVDRLDLDADGDGCSDAIEGGAAFTPANLVTSTLAGGNSGSGYTGTSTSPVTQNLGNTVGNSVTTLGVPTIAGTGQSNLYSKDVTVNACTDTDTDGVPDVEDLDDDNDGILDTVENAECTVVLPPTNVGTKAVTTPPTGWTIANSSPELADVIGSPYGSTWTAGCTSTAPAAPNGHTIFPLMGSPTQESIKTTVSNLIVGRTYQFTYYQANFGISNGTPGEVSVNLGTTTIHKFTPPQVGCYWTTRVATFTPTATSQELRFIPTLSSSKTVVVAVSANAISTVECDTDGDGIPNRLDLDSDGDGCSDAIEGGASFTAANTTSTGALSGSVSSATATLGVPTLAGTGQAIGTSQNAGVQDANCPPPCVAGTTAPTLSATSVSNVCPATTANLTSITASNLPANTTLTWHTGTPATTANKITGTAVAAGTYYAAFFDATGNCYSGISGSATTAVTVTITTCCPTITNTSGDNTNPSACGAATGSIKICGLTANASGYTINYDKNGTAATALTNQTADASGCITITGLTAGSYTNIKISGTECPSGSNGLSATLTDPTAPAAPTGLAGVPSSGICVGTSVALSATGTTGATYTWTVSQTGATLASAAGTVSGTTASNTFNSTAAGTYTVSLTQTISGCTSAPATTSLTVNAAPSAVVPTATSKSNVCPTTTVDLTSLQPAAVSGVTYEWHTVASNPTSGTLVATPAAAASGTYYLYGKSASGCYSAASSAVTATVNACIPCTPVDPGVVSGSAASIKTGNTASFTLTGATAGATTTWAIFPSNGVSPNAGTGTSTGLVTFNIAGEYQVLFSTTNSNTPVGCSEPSFATATGQFTVEAPLSPCAKPSASSVGVSPTSAAISEGATASFTMSGGTPNSSVQWVIIPSTGVSPSSGTGTSTGSVTFATKGLYTAVFSIVNLGDGSCAPVQQSSSAPIAVGLNPCSPPTSILVNSSTANQASNVGQSVTFTATGGIPGAITWTVTPATGASPSSGTGSTATITFTAGGIYSVVFTSKNSTIPLGCTQPVNTSASIIHNVSGDTDGDGVSDAQEAIDGTNPNDGCSYNVANQVYASTSAAWKALDCDNDGTPNGTDSQPKNPCVPNANSLACPTGDTDGDGVSNGQEATDGTNPSDGCSYNVANQVLANTSAAWKASDCDNDGNTNGTDPNPLVPVATNDMLTAPQGVTSSINVLTNDDFLPGAGTSLTVISGGTATGTATFNPLTGMLSYVPAPGETGLVTLRYRVCNTVPNPDVCAEATVSITISATNAKLNLKVLLQGALLPTSSSGGPIMTGIMRDDLRTASPSQIPNLEPYTGLANSRFTHVGGGGETMGAGVLSAAGNDAIVDWVFVELRDKNNPATILKTRSALVQRDGDVVESTDGISPLTFTGAVGESYYVSVKHRNHLGAMTAGAIAMTATGTLVDFTTMTAAQTYHLPGYDGFEQVDVNGKMALWAGNTNADKKVKYVGVGNDQIPVFGQAVNYVTNTTQQYNFDFATPVYLSGDINMDAKVKYRGPNNDTSFIFFNVITKYALLNTGALYNYDLFIEQLP